ncbi:STY4851/ECs_5259 family protein [Mangrovicoccus sp. HB161399]|uniref:STY4851/ECs_5259 family protein n=1 Tax=Mangrovicoccus sp. HB161399 TaxID=2720392 RepID=UPI001C12FAEC|nr:STY4851/ECs_5259 family protein [Mangrovicoccus sp. HB161399]
MPDACDTHFPTGTPAPCQHLFDKIGLAYRSGQPLHAYRLRDDAVDLLQTHLVEAIKRRRLNEYAAVFVLWSAETFRREFDGGQYTWAFLTDRLNSTPEALDLQHIVQRGLTWFGRKLTRTEHGTTYYLKTLAAEGGLPEALLADTEGNTRRLVRGLLAEIDKVGPGAPEEVLDALTAQRAQALPMGFRTPEFQTLLREFCLLLLARKSEIPPGIPPGARQSWLDANRPGWKDALPLRIDSTAAQSLLYEAVRTENSAGRDTIATRHLVRVEDRWVPKLRIAQFAELPDWMMGLDEPGRLRSVRFLPDTDLAQQAPGLVLSAYREADSRSWEVRRDGSLRRAEIAMPLDAPVAFRLVAEGQLMGTHVPPGCEVQGDDDIPTIWAAEEKDPDGKVQSLRKLGASAQRTKAPHLWVLAQDGTARFEDLEATVDSRIGTATLWRVTGKGVVINSAGRIPIATAAEDEATDSLMARAASVPGLRDKNRSEFLRGLPTFQVLTVDGTGRRLTRKQMCWRAAGQKNWKKGLPDAATCLGTYQFCWMEEHGGLRAFTTVRLIPDQAQIVLIDCHDGFYECRTTGLPAGTVVSLGQGVSGMVPANGVMTLRMGDAASVLGRIPLHIRPPEDGARAFDATLPRPGDRGHFIDAEDRILQSDIELDLGSLRGWRIDAPTDRKAELRLRLQGEHNPRKPILLSVTNETSLSALLPRLRGLMAIGGPDSELRMRIMVGSTQSHRITLRRHLRSGEWNSEAFRLGLDNEAVSPGGLEVEAVNISAPSLSTTIPALHPGESPMPLLPEHPGPWMIFARDAEGLVRPPRPLEKTLSGEAIPAPRFSDEMLSCGQYRHRNERIAAFGKALRGLLSIQGMGDLGLYEEQLDVLGEGEALSSLDSVVALSDAPELACLLLLRARPEALGARLELESVSPFSWTTLPLNAWCKALSAQEAALFSQLLHSGLPEGDARNYSRKAVADRLRQILDRRPEIAGQIFLAAMETGIFLALKDICHPPPALNNPEAALSNFAQEAVKKHEAERQPFDLRSQYTPASFEKFFDGIRGLLDAPLVAAEHVLGLLPHPPDTETAVALLHYRLHDPDYFETAMPAAIALIIAKTK